MKTSTWCRNWALFSLLAAACAAPRPVAPVVPNEVIAEERMLVDLTRATREQGPFAGAAERQLITRLWYTARPVAGPACRDGRCALIVLAHGYGGHVGRLTEFAHSIAAAGYVVAAPLFPLTNDRAPGGYLPGFDDVANQPGDLSFVIDEMIDAARDRGDPLYERIDLERIGAIGHSMGGTTLIGATRLDCCTDRRISAAVLVAPAVDRVRPIFATDWRQSGPPTMVVVGTEDVVVPLTMAHDFVDTIGAPRVLVELDGATHVDLMENGAQRPHRRRTELLAIAFLDAYLGGANDELKAALAAARDAGEQVRWDP